MKKIEAVIRPHKLEYVVEMLRAQGIEGLTVIETRGFGRQKEQTEIYSRSYYETNFFPKVWIMTVVADDQAEEVIATIMKEARTGKIGDGNIFVSDIKSAIRIRTGETGSESISSS